MKYIIILGDGMADEPQPNLAGMTPLEFADTPNMDRLAAFGRMGMARTIPDGMHPGSDAANLSVLGYDPRTCYSGRAPLEALSIGVPMTEGDIAVRTNLVTLSEEDLPYEEQTILDHSADEISTGDAAELLGAVRGIFPKDVFSLHTGTSYRELLLWHGGRVIDMVPPHDVLGQKIGPYLPSDPTLRGLMEESCRVLKDHPLNRERKAAGKHPANSLWFWGAGTKPELPSFFEKTGKRGAMISAVDLLKGIAVGAGMDKLIVQGATGSLDTNYEGKASAALRALNGDYDFVYVHVEAPDEMSHRGSLQKKIRAIEDLDQRLIGPILNGLKQRGTDFRMLIMPDHPTPLRLRTHTADPVPWLLYDSRDKEVHPGLFNEKEAQKSGIFCPEGWKMIDLLLEG